MQSPYAMALWGRCRSCMRWFSVQTRHDEKVRWQCPVCGEDPDQLENRAHPAYADRPAVPAGPAGRASPECWYG